MSRAWRLVLVGPADLERSIVDSALRQAGFELAVPNHFADLEEVLAVDGLHAVLVIGEQIGRERESLDLVHDVLAATQRNQALVIQLVDDDQQPAVSGAAALRRPLNFPAAAAELSRMIEAHQERVLTEEKRLESGSLRRDLSRIASAELSGVLVIERSETPGEIHVRSGRLSLIVSGGLTGAEALSVLLGSKQGSYRFDRQRAPQGETERSVEKVIAEADAAELRTAEMMARAPQGALDVDPERLVSRLNRLHDDVAWIFRLIDGQRDMEALWRVGGLRAIEGALSLIEDGILEVQRGAPRTSITSEMVRLDDLEPVGQPDRAAEDLEEDFAWTLAVEGVSGLPDSTLQDDEWESLDRDWDQLPDLELGIEGALSAAQQYFQTQAPDDEPPPEVGIEPLLEAADEAPEDEFEPPPVLADEEVYADEDEVPPILDDLIDDPPSRPRTPLVDEPPPRQPYQPVESSQTPYRAMGTGTFGHDDQITSVSDDLEVAEPGFAQRVWVRFRFAVIAAALFGVAAYTTYSHSQRIAQTTQGEFPTNSVEPRPAPAPTLPEPSEEGAKPAEPAPQVKPRRAPPPKKARKRRKRRRRVRRANRQRLRQGEFAKRMQGARMLRDDGNLEGAIELISMGLKLSISPAERSIALSERGEAHFSAGSINRAKTDLRSAIAADSTNTFALKNLGLIEYQSFKGGDESARSRAVDVLKRYQALTKRRDAAVERWLAELD